MSEICKEVRFISQLSLDGVALGRNTRDKASQHREQCHDCRNFHETLIQATALASDISTDDVFNPADMASVAQKLKVLLDEFITLDDSGENGDNYETDANTIESRLHALLDPGENTSISARMDDEPGQLISCTEDDGRIVETFLDQKGWTTTRIRTVEMEVENSGEATMPLPHQPPATSVVNQAVQSASPVIVDLVSVEPPQQDPSPSMAAPIVNQAPQQAPLKPPSTPSHRTPSTPLSKGQIHSAVSDQPPQGPTVWTQSFRNSDDLSAKPGDYINEPEPERIDDDEDDEFGDEPDDVSGRHRQTLFDLTETDIDQIFGRMYVSRSRERRKPLAVPIDNNVPPKQPDILERAVPPTRARGFAVSADALARYGKINVDKLDEIIDAQGCIKDLGKFLLDPEAVNAFERIIKSREVNVLVNRLTTEQNAVLERLQTYMHQQHAVVATLVVGRDNQVLSGRYRSDATNEDIAHWALCAYINSKTAAQLLNSQELYHIILSNNRGSVIISDLGQTFLITVTDKQDSADREALMRKLESLLG